MVACKHKNKGTNPDGSKRPKLGNAVVSDTAHIAIECTVEGGTFYGGTFNDGIFEGGTFYGGTFNDGVFEDGTFYDGTFNEGVFEGGTFEGGVFNGGVFNGGTFQGGSFNDGTFYGGTFKNGVFNNTSDVLQFFALGYRIGWTTAYVVDGVVMVSAGCFYDTLDEFKKAVKNGNARQRKNYSAVIPLMKGLLK